MKSKLCIVFFVMVLLMTGCSEKTDEEIFYKAQKQMVDMKTYICTADITIYGNKTPIKYTAKQWYKEPNKYKIEVISPENLEGKVTIYNGKRAWVSHPRIGQEWLMEDFSSTIEQKFFLGYFLNNFLSTENPQLTRETVDDKEYILIGAEIPGNHPYFTKERLWFDIKKYYPRRLQVLDTNDNVIINVEYIDFKFNENLDDNIFKIKGDI